MGTVNPSQSSPGETIEASDVNTPVNQLAAVVNGNIETVNLADNAVTTAKIADGSVTPAKISGTAWASWTPTFTNVSGGATTYAKYMTIGKTVHFRLKYTLAGAGISGAILFTLPSTAHADYATNDTIGTASILDSGTAGYLGFLMLTSTSQAEIRPVNSSGTNATYTAGTSSSNPIATWASGDFFQCSGTYEIA